MVDQDAERLDDASARYAMACRVPPPAVVEAWMARWPEARREIAERVRELRARVDLPTYDEVVTASDMKEARKAHWLRDG